MNFFSVEYRMFLAEHKVFDAWQYINNVRKNITTAGYCYQILDALISQMTSEHNDWLEELNRNLAKQIEEHGAGSIAIGSDDFPDYKMDILGVTVDYPFLIDKYIKDFFQYIRNAFDGMAQITNAALLANENKGIEKVDFNKIIEQMKKPKYSALFPKSTAYLTEISDSFEFKYTSEFNNLVKHICDARVIISHELFGGESTTRIGSFYKKNQQFSEEDISGITKRVLDYVENQYNGYLEVITEEIELDTFVFGRIHSLEFYGQQVNDDSGSSFAVVFIQVQESLDELPDELRILLVNDKDDVMSSNCDYDEILVRDKNEKYIGQFIRDDNIANDSILRYRRYKKDSSDGMIAFIKSSRKNKPIKLLFMDGIVKRDGFDESDK